MTVLGAVIPAAGRSQRMGRSKPLLTLGDTDFLGTILKTLRSPDVAVALVAVVYRADDEPLRERIAAHVGEPVIAVPVEPGSGDMLHSVRAGAYAMVARAMVLDAQVPSGAMVWPVDAPAVAPATVAAVAAAARRAPDHVAQPEHEGAPGHPVYVPRLLLEPAAVASAAGPGLRGLIEGAQVPVDPVPVSDPRCLVNVNTPEDYEAYRAEVEGDA